MLHIRLFGHLTLWAEERSLSPSGRREVDRLLAYLVLHPSGPTARARVADALWPDMDTSEALRKLRLTLNHLQVYLRDCAPSPTDRQAWLLVDRATLCWNAGAPCRVDALEFEAECSRLLAPAVRPLDPVDSDIEAIEATLRQYGGPLLRDLGDAWAVEMRGRLEAAWLALQAHLAILLARSGRHEQAVEVATRAMALAADPLWESGHRMLMQVYAQVGNRVKALEQYDQCCEALREELGTGPSTETSLLAEAIRRNQSPDGRSQRIVAVAWSDRRADRAGREGIRQDLGVPITSTTLVGQWRVNQVAKCLEHSRLLTLTGPPGVGKSRVAGAAAARLAGEIAHGPCWLDLAVLRRSTSLAEGLADRLGLSATAIGAIAANLGRSPSTLVLDNAEARIGECAALVVELLAANRNVRIVVTSREPLAVGGERVWSTPLLSLPDAEASSAAHISEAELLFADRAARYGRPTKRDLPTQTEVVAICRRLDGLPWAIELAAACTRTRSLTEIAARAEEDCLALLDEAGPIVEGPRFCSVTSALESSFVRLEPASRALLRRLSAFPEAFSSGQAESVGAGDLGGGVDVPAETVLDWLDRLVAGSWVVVDINAPPAHRHRLLSVIRHFGRRKLTESGELAVASQRQSAATGQGFRDRGPDPDLARPSPKAGARPAGPMRGR